MRADIAYFAMEQREIMDHWDFIERVLGHFDKTEVFVSETYAVFDWINNHEQSFHEYVRLNKPRVEKVCRKHCGSECRGMHECPLVDNDLDTLLSA